jgi:hypothetical protein
MMYLPFDFFEDGSQCSAEVVLPNMPLRGRATSVMPFAAPCVLEVGAENVRNVRSREVDSEVDRLLSRRITDIDLVSTGNTLESAIHEDLKTGLGDPHRDDPG